MDPSIIDYIAFPKPITFMRRRSHSVICVMGNVVWVMTPFNTTREMSGMFHHEYQAKNTIKMAEIVYLPANFPTLFINGGYYDNEDLTEFLLVYDNAQTFILISLGLGMVVNEFRVSDIGEVVDIVSNSKLEKEFIVVTKNQLLLCEITKVINVKSRINIRVDKIEEFMDGFLLLSKYELLYLNGNELEKYFEKDNVLLDDFMVDDGKLMICKKDKNDFWEFQLIEGDHFKVKTYQDIYCFRSGYFAALCNISNVLLLDSKDKEKHLLLNVKNSVVSNFDRLLVDVSPDRSTILVFILNCEYGALIKVPLELIENNLESSALQE